MEPAEYQTLYETETRHWWYRALHRLVRQYLQRHVATPADVLIDVGCGTGATLSHLQSGFRFAAGIDFSPDAVAYCRRRGLTRTAQGSAEALPIGGASADLVVSLDVIQHRGVLDEHRALQEMYRILKPGGRLMLNLPAYRWLYSSHDVAVHTGNRYTRRQVLGILRRAGFEPLTATYWNSMLLPLAVAVRLWRKLLPRSGSDLDTMPPAWQGAVFGSVLSLERYLLRFMALPFGLSVFAVARKPLR